MSEPSRPTSTAVKALLAEERYADAERLLESALGTLTERYGTTHESVATVEQELAEVKIAQGDYDEAESLLIRVNLARVNLLGPEHPDALRGLLLLGDVYLGQREYEAAETIYERALENAALTLGPEHELTTAAVNGLITTYEDWPAEDGQTAQPTETLRKLPMLYVAREDWAKAEETLERLVALDEAAGSTEPEAFDSRSQLIMVIAQKGEQERAESLQRDLVERRTQAFGADSPELIGDLTGLALMLTGRERYDEAESLLVRAITIDSTAPAEPPAIGMALSALASVYVARGERERAIPLLRSIVLMMELALGADHEQVQAVREQYAAVVSGAAADAAQPGADTGAGT